MKRHGQCKQDKVCIVCMALICEECSHRKYSACDNHSRFDCIQAEEKLTAWAKRENIIAKRPCCGGYHLGPCK